MNKLTNQVTKFVAAELNCRGLDTDTDFLVSDDGTINMPLRDLEHFMDYAGHWSGSLTEFGRLLRHLDRGKKHES